MNRRQQIIADNHYLLELWARAQNGDKSAFCQLAESQYRVLYRYAGNFTTDAEFIKDSIQDLFINIWEKRRSIAIQYIAIYLLKALRNQLFQELRRKKLVHAPIDEDDVFQLSDGYTVEKEIVLNEHESESQKRLQQAIYYLPKRQQEVVFLKYYQGFDNEQIADLMAINRQSVANLLYKALTALKSQLTVCSH
nr:sigma-70 family RNA polymerase sigma factor [uncultured Arsenicibacter sp.]